MAETNAQRKKRRIIPNTLASEELPAVAPPAASSITVDPRQQSQFGRGLRSGAQTLQAIGSGLAGAAGAAVGADEFAEEQLRQAEEQQARASVSGPRVTRIEDITNLEDTVDFIAGVAGQQLPILATTFGGGLTGVAARRAIPGAAKRISPTAAGASGAVATGIGLETGSIFGDIASDPESRENFTLRELAGISAVGGTAAGSLEALPIISAFRRFGLGKSATRSIRSSLAKRVGKGAGAQALLEGGTEGAQTVIERAAAKFANENREILGEEGVSEILNAIAAGIIIGAPTGALSGGFQRGSIEDQLDLEESLDELETTGGTSTEIDNDLSSLGEVGLDIRAARDLSSELELETDPAAVVSRLLKRTVEVGALPTRRSFAQLTQAIGNLDNPAQLDNIIAEAGVDPEIQVQLRDALLGEVEGQREDFISLAVDERPTTTFEETGEGFQAPNVSRSHILRNRNGKLGFIEANDPQQENALRSTLARLESDFPDITFGTTGLGDAIADSLPEATRKDPNKARSVLFDVANEKLNEVGFNAARFAELDPNNPREFLNQFRAISKQEVDVSLTGRDEFRLTDSDLLGGARPAVVQVGGPVTTKAGKKTRARATVSQGKNRPIFLSREPSKTGDFAVSRKGRAQTVDAIALTNRMLTKQKVQRAPTTDDIRDAFFTGLSALVQRGVLISKNDASSTQLDLFPEFNIADDLVVHKARGANGKQTTFGELRKSGSGRIRSRVQAFKRQREAISVQLTDVIKKLNSERINPGQRRGLEKLQKKLKRRIKKIPTEIETLLVFGKTASRDVRELTNKLKEAKTKIERQDNANELRRIANDKDTIAAALDAEARDIGDIALEVRALSRQLEAEGFNTQGAEQLSEIGEALDRLEEFASLQERAARQRIEEAEDAAGELGGPIRFPESPDDLLFSAAFSRGIETLGKPSSTIESAPQDFVNREFDSMTETLGITNARVLTGFEVFAFLEASDNADIRQEFVRGELNGLTISIFGDKRALPTNQRAFFGDADHIILINPYLTRESYIREILSHEVGHVVFKNEFEAMDAATQDAVRAEYNQWLEATKGMRANEVLASRESFERALRTMAGGWAGQSMKKMKKVDPDMYAYLINFEEWFADQVGRWFSPTPTQVEQATAVDRFFKSIADKIKQLWDKLLTVTDFKPAASVEAFLNDMAHSEPEIEIRVGVEGVIQVAAARNFDTDNMGIASIFQLMDPFDTPTNWAVRQTMKDNLKPDERKTVFRYFNRRSTKNRLKKLLTDPQQQALIENSPLHAAVFGYQMWIAGTFQLQTASAEVAQQAQEAGSQALAGGGTAGEFVGGSIARAIAQIFTGLFDAISSRLGFIYESEEAEQILDAIRDGTIAARKAGNGKFSVTKAVRGDVLQRVAQAGNDAFLHIKPFFDKGIGVADSRMLDSGIPALITIAQKFHARTGSENQPETFFEARRTQIGKFMNSYTRITEALQQDQELKTEVLGLMRNPKKKGSAQAIAHASAIRKLLRRIRNYIGDSGVEIGDRGKDYFPWVFDPRKIQDNSDFIRGLLADDRFAANMKGILNNINTRIVEFNNRAAGNNQPLVTKAELIERMMMGLEQSEGLADTNLNPQRSGTVPFFGAMNKRTLGFLTKEKGLTKEERERFDGLFSDQLDLIMMTYIRQGVKRTEYTKRFGFDSGKLEGLLAAAVDEGASAADMRKAHLYIDSMTGVIGEDTNNRVSKLLGLGPRKGEVINPHWRTFTSIAMVLQNLAVLPLATFTSLVDPVGILVRSQDMTATMAALRTGAREIVAEVRLIAGGDEKKIRSELRKLGEAMGTIEDHMTNEALEWEYGSTYLTPRLKAVNEFFFKAIGLTQWTRVTRLMALAGGKEFIKRHVQRPNDNSERFLRQLDITAEDVRFDKDGDMLILTRLEREGENALPQKELDRDDRVRNALNRFVDESILRPNAAQRPIWASDPNYALIFHLKSFMFSFHDRILRRASQEAEMGNTAPLMLLAVFIPAMLFADILRDLIQFGTGGNPRKANWGLEDHMWSATQRSGLNGIGQLLIDAQQDVQFGGFGYESLAGPTVDGIKDLGGLFSDDDQAQWNAFVRNLPGSSAWKHWLENGLDDS